MSSSPNNPESSEKGAALRARYGVSQAVRDAMVARMVRVLTNPEAADRAAIRATETLRKMQHDNFEADAAQAKDDRLDRGDPTETIVLKPITLRVTDRVDRLDVPGNASQTPPTEPPEPDSEPN